MLQQGASQSSKWAAEIKARRSAHMTNTAKHRHLIYLDSYSLTGQRIKCSCRYLGFSPPVQLWTRNDPVIFVLLHQGRPVDTWGWVYETLVCLQLRSVRSKVWTHGLRFINLCTLFVSLDLELIIKLIKPQIRPLLIKLFCQFYGQFSSFFTIICQWLEHRSNPMITK